MATSSLFGSGFLGLAARSGAVPAPTETQPAAGAPPASAINPSPPEPTIESLGLELEIPPTTLEGFAVALGAAVSTKVVRIAFIPEADVLAAVDLFKLGEVPAGALAKGDAMRLFRAAQANGRGRWACADF